MTQDEYALYTGQTVNFSEEDWNTLVNIAAIRLVSFLCLEELPAPMDDLPADFKLLLANFLCAVFKFQGAPDIIESKSVRNFTINFKSSAANAFEQIYKHYEDIIEHYSNCGTEINVERNARHCCGYYNNGLLNF